MVLRAMFLVVGIVLGLSLGWSLSDGQTEILGMGALIGAVVGVCILVAERRLQSVPLPVALWGGVGLVISLLIAGLIGLLTGLVGNFEHSVFSLLATLLLFLGQLYCRSRDRGGAADGPFSHHHQPVSEVCNHATGEKASSIGGEDRDRPPG